MAIKLEEEGGLGLNDQAIKRIHFFVASLREGVKRSNIEVRHT